MSGKFIQYLNENANGVQNLELTTPLAMGTQGNADCNRSCNVQAASQWVKQHSLKDFLKE